MFLVVSGAIRRNGTTKAMDTSVPIMLPEYVIHSNKLCRKRTDQRQRYDVRLLASFANTTRSIFLPESCSWLPLCTCTEQLGVLVHLVRVQWTCCVLSSYPQALSTHWTQLRHLDTQAQWPWLLRITATPACSCVHHGSVAFDTTFDGSLLLSHRLA